jgi:hypothetical protein
MSLPPEEFDERLTKGLGNPTARTASDAEAKGSDVRASLTS